MTLNHSGIIGMAEQGFEKGENEMSIYDKLNQVLEGAMDQPIEICNALVLVAIGKALVDIAESLNEIRGGPGPLEVVVTNIHNAENWSKT